MVRYQGVAAFGQELDAWVAQVQREVLPRFPLEAMRLFAAFLELDKVVFERVDDDGGYVGGAFELACRLWLTAAVAAGLSASEIADRAVPMLSADHYGARAALKRPCPLSDTAQADEAECELGKEGPHAQQ